MPIKCWTCTAIDARHDSQLGHCKGHQLEESLVQRRGRGLRMADGLKIEMKRVVVPQCWTPEQTNVLFRLRQVNNTKL